MIRLDTSTLIFNYTLKTHDVAIPFMENYRQEALFILAPKDRNYKPHMDSIKNSKAQRNNEKKVIVWDRNEYNVTKSIPLSIDSEYLVILRAFGQLLEDAEAINKTKQYATLDCVQKFENKKVLTTKKWSCLSNETIPAEKGCDLTPDCDDDSDETDFLCKREQTSFMINVGLSVYS